MKLKIIIPLVLSVFVRDLHIDEEEMEVEKPNYIFLDGYLCKTTGLSKDTAWKRNCGPFDGC